MEDGLSLRPLTLRPGGAGPGKNPFASFGRGAGASLAKKVSKLHDSDEALHPLQSRPSITALVSTRCVLTVTIDVVCRPRMWAQPKWREGNRREKSFDTTWIS